MRIIKLLSLIVIPLIISSCSSDNDESAAISAPSSIAGKTYNMTISSGSGFFATTGSYTVSFSTNQDLYIVEGDGVIVEDSAGIYTYNPLSGIRYLDISVRRRLPRKYRASATA